MPTRRDSVELRRELAERVIDELATDVPRISAHQGEQYADADEPEAQAMREQGGTFDWVAFGFDPRPMWDAHVGVLTVDGQVTIGLHIHERLSPTKPTAVATIADDVDAGYRFSDAASEHQFNRRAVPLDTVDVGDLTEEVAWLCRRFDPIVDAL